MSRRLGLWLLGLGAGVALLVSGALASPNGESRRGGTLRLGMGAPPDYVDPALANGLVESWTLLYPTCAKLFNTFPDPDTRRPRVLPEVVRSHIDHGRRPDVHLRAEADVPLPHRGTSDRSELRRRVRPQRQPADELGGTGLHAGHHRRRRSHAGNGDEHLGRAGTRPLPSPHPPGPSCGRLSRSADGVVLLPDPARHADPPGGDRPSGWIGALLHRGERLERAHRPRAESLLPGSAHGQSRPRSSGRSSPTGASGSRRSNEARPTSRSWGSAIRTRSCATSSEGTA